jgi:hypothetical protein
MHWKIKAIIQNAVSLLPPAGSYATYYWIQSHFGGLKRPDPSYWFFVGIEAWKRICNLGYDPVGKVFFELGTGRVPIVPLAFYLMGARKTITVDLNPYLKSELIVDALRHMSENRETMRVRFGTLLDQDRFPRLLSYYRKGQFDSATFLDMCGIEYIAPGDAANTPLNSNSVDFHTSNTTLEHIPREVLIDVLREGNRIVSDEGLFIHRIDYTDHFSHSDKSISPINFLQYSDEEWKKYANNRYMYMNRLRHDDLLRIFQLAGHRIVGNEPDVNKTVLESVSSGRFRLAERFKDKPLEVIATTGAWIMTQKALTRCASAPLASM